jgi:hypothetical protein
MLDFAGNVARKRENSREIGIEGQTDQIGAYVAD